MSGRRAVRPVRQQKGIQTDHAGDDAGQANGSKVDASRHCGDDIENSREQRDRKYRGVSLSLQ